ncbi:MAG TPA: hypothetical protein P5285_11955, partial [Desulfomonilia bacterium]|nr:hypothetical protein [Desulfomonilia bacterium]
MKGNTPGEESATPDHAPDAGIVSGVIEHVRYHREDTGYTVARVKPLGEEERSMTVVAHMPMPRTGDLYQFTGSWVRHPRYGLQF